MSKFFRLFFTLKRDFSKAELVKDSIVFGIEMF